MLATAQTHGFLCQTFRLETKPGVSQCALTYSSNELRCTSWPLTLWGAASHTFHVHSPCPELGLHHFTFPGWLELFLLELPGTGLKEAMVGSRGQGGGEGMGFPALSVEGVGSQSQSVMATSSWHSIPPSLKKALASGTFSLQSDAYWEAKSSR